MSYLDGYHQWRLPLNDQATLEMLTTVVPFEKIDALPAGRRALIDRSCGVMLPPDTFVGRPEYLD